MIGRRVERKIVSARIRRKLSVEVARRKMPQDARQMPGFTGLELQEVLTATRNILPIIFLTGYADVPKAVRALKGGAVDFLSFLEADFRFITLLQPVTDIEHILWQSPAGVALRPLLTQAGIEPGATRRHAFDRHRL